MGRFPKSGLTAVWWWISAISSASMRRMRSCFRDRKRASAGWATRTGSRRTLVGIVCPARPRARGSARRPTESRTARSGCPTSVIPKSAASGTGPPTKRIGEAATLKSLAVLMDTYYRSVGHGRCCSEPLARHHGPNHGRRFQARGGNGSGSPTAVWAKSAEIDGRGTTLELDLGQRSVVDHAITMEDIAHGERIRSYVIEGYHEGRWTQLCAGTSVGHKKIDAFAPVRMEKIRLRVLTASGSPVIRKLAVYHVGSSSRAATASGPQRIEVRIGSASSRSKASTCRVGSKSLASMS